MDFRSAFQEADTGVPFSNKSLIIAANLLLSQLKLLSEEQKLPAVDILLTSIWLSVHRKEDHPIRTPDSASLAASNPINVLQGDALQAESDNLPSSSLIKTAPYARTCIPAIHVDHDDTLQCEKGHFTTESSSETTIGSLIDNAIECTFSCKGGPCDHNNLHQTNSGCSNATCVAGKDNALSETVQTLNIGLTKCIPTNTTSHDVPPCRSDRETIRNENGIEDIDTDVSNSCSSADKNKGNITNHFMKDNLVENTNIPLKECNHTKVRHTCTCSPIPDKQLVNGDNDNCVCPKDQSEPRSEDAVQEEQRCVLKKDCNCNTSSLAAANHIKHTKSEQGLCDQVDSQVCFDSVTDSKNEVVGHSESQTCLNSFTGSDTVVKTSDGKTFQISSNHGLTFEDSFVIEKVDSDDSDDEMGLEDHDTGHLDVNALQCELEDSLDKTTDHEIGKRTDKQVSSKRCKLACAPIKDTYQTAHPCSLISVFDGRSVGSQGFNNAERADGVDTGTCNETERDKSFIMNYAESEQSMSEPKQNATANYNLNSLDQAQFERASLGGIISTDNDTDLKIINIAGGVNFYDENEESVSLDKNADYKLTKHVENFPFSFDRLTPSLSSCSSLYPNVIYSTISEPFMSVDQRPAIHDPSGLLVPSQMNFNACLANDFRGRIYQQFTDENIYINAGQQNTAQTYPYFVPDTDTPYWHQPIKSELIKSESKVLTASKYISASKKKKKHSTERKDYIERDSCLKNFYNIRDANGKFIKMPYVNNIHNNKVKTSPNSVVKLGSVNGAANMETNKSPALKQNQFNSIGTCTSPKMMYAKKAQPVNTKKQSASLKLKLSNKLLENELLKIDQRLGVLRAKTKGTSKNKLTKREKKTLRYLAKKRVTIHNKIVAAKKKLNASEKPKLTPSYEAQPKSNECNPQEEYVVKETNTRVNPDGSTQEYKVVVIKGILPKGGKQVPKNTEVIKKRRIEEEDSKQLTLTQTKKKNSAKGKGNSTPKNSLLVPQSTRPVTFCKKEVEHLKEESTSIVVETKLKNSKSKAVGKKVLKLKNSILNKTKDIPAKKKHKKKKPVVASAHNNTAAPSQAPTMETVESVLNFDTDNNLPEFDTGKPTIDKTSTCSSVVKKKGRQPRSHKKKAAVVKELVETEKPAGLVDELKGRPTKSHKKKAAVVKELVETEKPVGLVDELIQLHHGERGAKLAAQQRISAYNESLSADFISQGTSIQQP